MSMKKKGLLTSGLTFPYQPKIKKKKEFSSGLPGIPCPPTRHATDPCSEDISRDRLEEKGRRTHHYGTGKVFRFHLSSGVQNGAGENRDG